MYFRDKSSIMFLSFRDNSLILRKDIPLYDRGGKRYGAEKKAV